MHIRKNIYFKNYEKAWLKRWVFKLFVIVVKSSYALNIVNWPAAAPVVVTMTALNSDPPLKWSSQAHSLCQSLVMHMGATIWWNVLSGQSTLHPACQTWSNWPGCLRPYRKVGTELNHMYTMHAHMHAHTKMHTHTYAHAHPHTHNYTHIINARTHAHTYPKRRIRTYTHTSTHSSRYIHQHSRGIREQCVRLKQ